MTSFLKSNYLGKVMMECVYPYKSHIWKKKTKLEANIKKKSTKLTK